MAKKTIVRDGKEEEVFFINVKPLRNTDEINEFRWALGVTGKARDVMLFSFGINTGLRISDILPLRVRDVLGYSNIQVYEQKTKKFRDVYINAGLRKEIENYARKMAPSDFLFMSQKGKDKPISRTQAYRVLDKAAKLLEREDIGTHTMRKTFGYMHYKKNRDVATLQTIFNHDKPETTLIYIGITNEEIEKSQEDMGYL